MHDTPLSCSIALATFNGARFLPTQLDSLLAQTRRPDEIIIRDDASVDGSWTLLESFAHLAKKAGVAVRLLRSDRNGGYVENFSCAVAEASGDVVFFCDQDDVWHPQKMATMMDRFERDLDLLYVCTDAHLVDAAGLDTGVRLFDALELTATERLLLKNGSAFDVLLRRGMATGATSAFRRDLAAMALPIPRSWIHDEWFAIVAAAQGPFAVIDQPLIDYRQHEGNQIGMRKRTLADKWREIRAPRATQFEREVKRTSALEQRLLSLASSPQRIHAVIARRAHFERRHAIGMHTLPVRVWVILQEACAGHYTRFGTGIRSMLRDLLRRD